MRGAAGIAKGVEQNPGLLLQRIGTLRVGQAGIGEREPQVLCRFVGLLQLRGRCPFAYYAATLARRLGRADAAAAAMRALVDAGKRPRVLADNLVG